MEAVTTDKHWFFVDESGDPTFYDRLGNYIVGQPGCSRILLLGFVETEDSVSIRSSLHDLRTEIINDPYFQEFPSIRKTELAFHAKDDVPEVRYRVFKLLAGLNFKAQFIVARKIERVFRNTFNAKETGFYDHLITMLFQNALHRHEENHIYFAKRGLNLGRCRFSWRFNRGSIVSRKNGAKRSNQPFKFKRRHHPESLASV